VAIKAAPMPKHATLKEDLFTAIPHFFNQSKSRKNELSNVIRPEELFTLGMLISHIVGLNLKSHFLAVTPQNPLKNNFQNLDRYLHCCMVRI
jgi:hypothetical protein